MLEIEWCDDLQLVECIKMCWARSGACQSAQGESDTEVSLFVLRLMIGSILEGNKPSDIGWLDAAIAID